MSSEATSKRVLFAWPSSHGSVLHAVIDNYRNPEDHLCPELGPGAHSGDPQPWLRSGVTLCGVRGGHALLHVTPDEDFTPQGSADRKRAAVCPACARQWSARFAPVVTGWTKPCTTCGQDKPVNTFSSDQRTRDGFASVCETCRAGLRSMSRQMERVLRDAAQEVERLEMLRVRAREGRDALTAWQSAPWLATFTCAGASHVLRADVRESERPYIHRRFGVAASRFTDDDVRHETTVEVVWRCACGTQAVDPHVVRLVRLCSSDEFADLLNADLGPVEIGSAPVVAFGGGDVAD